MSDTKFNITLALVNELIATQFPQWAHLPIKPVAHSGWDNKTFHLGTTMSIRLPSAKAYIEQVAKEQTWLPKLAPHLPLPIPTPIAMGIPSQTYPYPWSIYKWLDGENPTHQNISDHTQFATTLAHFLIQLQKTDPTDGPPPGTHNFYRGGPLTIYDTETRNALTALHGQIDTHTATAVWETALNATYQGTPVWLHGDVSAGNLLIQNGHLSAVIDFGSSAVGDPACDLTIAYTFLSEKSREAFRNTIQANDAMWARARGWALWKALITLAQHINGPAVDPTDIQNIIHAILADHKYTA